MEEREHFEYRDLDVSLTEEEVGRYSQQLPLLVGTYGETEAEKKRITGELGAKLKALRGAMDTIGEKIRTRKEERSVKCFLRFDIEGRLCDVVREDTLEVVEQRKMTSREIEAARQTRLEFNEEKARKMVEEYPRED